MSNVPAWKRNIRIRTSILKPFFHAYSRRGDVKMKNILVVGGSPHFLYR